MTETHTETRSDYYQVLELDRHASTMEISTAALALGWNYLPSRNPSDPRAQARFDEIREAHRVLSNEATRKAYNNHGFAYMGYIGQPMSTADAEVVQPLAFRNVSDPIPPAEDKPVELFVYAEALGRIAPVTYPSRAPRPQPPGRH